MPAKRQDKVAIVEELKKDFAAAQVTVVTEYRGLNVAEITELRRKLREAGGKLKVAKNTLARIAAREQGLEGLEAYLEGPTALAFGFDDPAAVPKVLSSFAKDHKVFVLKGGIFEGTVMDESGIKRLADLPSREELLARVVGGFQAPLAGLVNVLQGNIRNLVYALEAVRKQRAGEA